MCCFWEKKLARCPLPYPRRTSSVFCKAPAEDFGVRCFLKLALSPFSADWPLVLLQSGASSFRTDLQPAHTARSQNAKANNCLHMHMTALPFSIICVCPISPITVRGHSASALGIRPRRINEGRKDTYMTTHLQIGEM
jgi:hypothetical protein